MLITIAKHKRLTEEALDTEIKRNKSQAKFHNEEKERTGLFIEGQRREIDDLRDRLAKSVTRNAGLAKAIADMEDEIAAMKPDYLFGRDRREAAEIYNEARRVRRQFAREGVK